MTVGEQPASLMEIDDVQRAWIVRDFVLRVDGIDVLREIHSPVDPTLAETDAEVSGRAPTVLTNPALVVVVVADGEHGVTAADSIRRPRVHAICASVPIGEEVIVDGERGNQ